MRSVVAFVLAFVACGVSAWPARASVVTTQRVAGARFAALAKPELQAVVVRGDTELVQAYPVPDQILPPGKLALVVGSAIVNPAFVNVPVEIDVDGKFTRQIFVGYRVQRYVHTAVATHDLVPGTVLKASDVKIARVLDNGARINGTQALVGRKVLGVIRAGMPVPIEFTQTNEIVHAGMSVVLIVLDSGVAVAADGVARTSGGLGDDVSVYNPQTNKTLSATVVGPDRVELNLGDSQ